MKRDLPTWRDVAVVFVVALLVRAVALPLATISSGDDVMRVWLSWLWSEHPFLITEGVWAPLHFYLTGAVLAVWPEPMVAPAVLHVVIGSIAPVGVYLLARELFGSNRAALLAGLAFAVYPIAISNSLAPKSETPFVMFMAFGLYFLARARRTDARLRSAVAAGICIGLGTMLRYEAWMLLPFMALLLVHRPQRALVFVAVAMIHPVFWMAGNWMAHGDPLYSFTWTSWWEREAMGKAAVVSVGWRIDQAIGFWRLILRQMTPVVVILSAAGIYLCLRHRRPQAVWLLVPLGLAALMQFAILRGSLTVKPSYMVNFGLLLMPFTAAAWQTLGVDRWSRRTFLAAGFVLVAAIGVCTVKPLLQAIPGGGRLLVSVAPRFGNEEAAQRVLTIMASDQSRGTEALVSDFLGWTSGAYVAFNTKLHPSNICIAQGAPGLPEGVSATREFLVGHPTGTLIRLDGGRLSRHFAPVGHDRVQFAGLTLDLIRLGETPWTGPAPGAGAAQAGELPRVHVDRYVVVAGVDRAEEAPESHQYAYYCPVAWQ